MTDWNSIQNLLINEFHTPKFTHRALDWLQHPIANSQNADPLITATWFCLIFSALVYIMGFITKKYSWVDKSWSVLPPAYAWYFVHCIPTTHTDLVPRLAELAEKHPRPLLMAVLATLWGIRLTFNFARKGGYTYSGEDYRWQFLQSCKIFNNFFGKILWEIFALGFIALYQNIVIMLFTIPAYVAYKHSVTVKSDGLTVFDIVLAVAWIVFLTIETVADQQQWNYYIRRDKYRALSKAEQQSKQHASSDESRGFNTTGLYAHSRHPNFFAEQSLWLTYYLFSVVVTGKALNWSITGVLLLMGIFAGSTWFTELISCTKYPAYRAYQRYVPRTIPSLTAKKVEWRSD